jgi:nucleotide-binding universal stress UspA family protein
MKKIIVPIDFSDTALNAALYAGNMAEFYGADLWLYHAYEMLVPATEYGYTYISEKELHEAAVQELELFKNKIQRELRRTINIFTAASNAKLTDGLDELCGNVDPDLVVMGLSGKNALTRLIVGSNTIRAIHQLPYPVLVVPPGAIFIPVRKIGLACDFEKILEYGPVETLKAVVHDLHAELFVVHVKDINGSIAEGEAKESMYAGELLHSMRPSYQTVVSAGVRNGINWFAEKEKIDWIVMVPRKHNFAEKIFGKSETNDLLRHTHLPVLCMHD